MRAWLSIGVLLLGIGGLAAPSAAFKAAAQRVYILPLREDIMPPLVYLVRRGVKEAMEARADLLVIDMETNGGRVDVTEQIIKILDQFKGQTVTFVNKKAFSAGAFIAVATEKIYMAPGSVIGAAAPLLMLPGGAGVEKTSDTVEIKMTSGISALVRASAEKHGHNKQVVEAMIDKSKELILDGEVLNEKGRILTLTNTEAEKKYGQPPRPLLSLGTVESVDSLLTELGLAGATRQYITPTGAEKLAFWIDLISPVLLIVGIVGLYIEFKTPGFGLPGIVGIIAFAIYFLGGYVGGLSGLEWAAVFVLGLALLILELFLFPGTMIMGLTGALLMLAGIVMAMVDMYPGMPAFPSLPQLQVPVRDLMIAMVGAGTIGWVLSRWLPNTSLYHTMISQSASGDQTVRAQQTMQQARMGQVGVAASVLRPGGKAQFGDALLDVITQGEMLAKGRQIRIIGYSANAAIVEPAD